VTFQEFCELEDMKNIIANLRMVLINEHTGFNDYRIIGIVYLDGSAIRDMKQVLIMTVYKTNIFSFRVKLIDHFVFPPFSNSILYCGFPSAVTVMTTVASNILPVFADLQPFSLTFLSDRSFCATVAVRFLLMLSK